MKTLEISPNLCSNLYLSFLSSQCSVFCLFSPDLLWCWDSIETRGKHGMGEPVSGGKSKSLTPLTPHTPLYPPNPTYPPPPHVFLLFSPCHCVAKGWLGDRSLPTQRNWYLQTDITCNIFSKIRWVCLTGANLQQSFAALYQWLWDMTIDIYWMIEISRVRKRDDLLAISVITDSTWRENPPIVSDPLLAAGWVKLFRIVYYFSRPDCPHCLSVQKVVHAALYLMS